MKTQLEITNYIANAGFGVKFPAKMIILETEFDYTLISPCKISENKIQEIKMKNKNINIIAPNNLHNLYLGFMKDNFKEGAFYGPKRSAKVSKVNLLPTRNFNVANIETIFIEGHSSLSETVFFIKDLKILIVTDLLFNMTDSKSFSSSVAFLIAGTYKKLGMSRLLKSTTSNKKRFKDSLQKLDSFDFDKVILNHGENLTKKDFMDYIKRTL